MLNNSGIFTYLYCDFWILKVWISSRLSPNGQAGPARKPVVSESSGMTIAQEAARNVDPSTGPKTTEEEEKQRKRLEAWKKMQAAQGSDDKEKDWPHKTCCFGCCEVRIRNLL